MNSFMISLSWVMSKLKIPKSSFIFYCSHDPMKVFALVLKHTIRKKKKEHELGISSAATTRVIVRNCI